MINLTLVSPSSIGAYAACTQKLVYDSTLGKPFGSSEYADFGTLCHYQAMFKMGLNPRKEPTDAQFKSAARLPEFYGQSDEVLLAAMEACADRAISALNSLYTLPKDVFWIAEHEVADKTLLPTRVSRTTGLVKGYGGDIDLLRSDREALVDFKFVSKIPGKCKIEYLWQMGSYHLITGVPKTTLLFVTRDARLSASINIDWTYPKLAEYAKQMRKTIAKMGHSDFEQYATPIEGDQCDFCQHKGICPTKALPTVNHHMKLEKKPLIAVDTSVLDTLSKMVAARKPIL